MSGAAPGRRRIRVAYVTGSLWVGGSERQMVMLADRLPADRFEVEFVLLGAPGPFADQARAAGARLFPLHGKPRGSTSPPVWALRVVRSVADYIRVVRRRRYDIVDAWLYGAYALAAVTRPLTGVPVFVAGRRSLSDYKAHFSIAQRLVDRIATAQADAIVANADAVADDVRRREGLHGPKLRVIRNGVEIVPSLTPAERGRVRSGWGVPEGAVVVGCVANYKPGKGLELLIDAFARVTQAHREAHLVLVGQGPLREPIIQRAETVGLSGRVHLAGETTDPRPLYSAFDISVLASESEGLPNVLLEAAAAGRPLVATDAGASREIVVDGVTGMLVPVGDGPAVAESIMALLRDPQLRERLGTGARQRAIDVFGPERSAAEFAALYEELVERKGFHR